MSEESRSRYSRRGFLKTVGAAGMVVGAGAALAACGGGSSGGGSRGTTSFKVSLGWITNVEFAGFWLAADRGYYKDEGLDVTFKGGGTNTPLPHVQVASGAADFAVDPNMQQILQVIAQGNDLVLLGADFQTDPSGLLSLAKHPVRTAADLPGLRILSQQGTQPVLNAIYQANRLPTNFEFIPTGFDPGALVQGKGDAYNCFVTNQPITLENKFGLKPGTGYDVVTYADLGCPAYADIIACKRSLVREKRDAVVGFMRASARGWQDNAADPSAAVKLVMRRYGVDLGLDEKEQTRENELQIPLTQSALTKSKGILNIDPGLMGSTMYRWLGLAGAKNLPDPTKIVDTSILADVFKNGARL